jgi:hypothetical protein
MDGGIGGEEELLQCIAYRLERGEKTISGERREREERGE